MPDADEQATTAVDDLIGINIGGEKVIQVKRSLFFQLKDNYLVAAFSSRWEDKLCSDRDGNAFFDYSPEVMMPLIHWLRELRDSDPSDPGSSPLPPRICPGHRQAWLKMLNHFAFQEEDLMSLGAIGGHGLRRLIDSGVDCSTLREAGYTAEQWLEAGYSARHLLEAGFNVRQLRAAGFDAMQLYEAGFDAGQLRWAGFDAGQLQEAGFRLQCKDLPGGRTPSNLTLSGPIDEEQ
eukprot:TRINITY_DN95995_c0_g1_i1.p1 TRINITY_DN95995_c0_g1~~TRINITY_DN95995_c0_g1_i1.p1  ORF type:complete len:235 (-),score=64.23 TRINITY_DN95995_c0_g1_i1:41-745(-)